MSANQTEDLGGRWVTHGVELIGWSGQLHNRAELVRSIGGRAAWHDVSDGRIAAAAYALWGTPGLNKLIGDWSLVLRHHNRRAVVLARDFAGVRPLYYRLRGHRLTWSFSLAGLCVDPDGIELDEQYVADFVLLGASPNRTPYLGIHSVPAGHALHVSADHCITRTSLWSVPCDTARAIACSDCEEELRHLLLEAVSVRLAQPGPAVAELSGGFDSSTVVIVAASLVARSEVAAQSLDTVSFVTSDSLDLPFISIVEHACKLSGGVRLSLAEHPLFRAESAAGAAPSATNPLLDAAAAFARRAKAVTYLTGQGGDLVFGNHRADYSEVAACLVNRDYQKALASTFAWSTAARIPVLEVLTRSVAESLRFRRWSRPFASLAGSQARGSELLSKSLRRLVEEVPRSFTEDWKHAPVDNQQRAQLLTVTRELNALQVPEALERWNYTHPLFHRPLVEFLMRLPARMVFAAGQPRLLMKRACAGWWPTALRTRRSKGLFGTDYFTALKPFAQRLLSRGEHLLVAESGWVDATALKRQLNQFVHGLAWEQLAVRQVLLLEHWLRTREQNSAYCGINNRGTT